MIQVRPLTAGLALAIFTAVFHAAWAFLVAVGWAQALMDIVFRLHFMQPVFHIAAFDGVTALLLLAYAGVVGFILGFVGAVIWNAFARAQATAAAPDDRRHPAVAPH